MEKQRVMNEPQDVLLEQRLKNLIELSKLLTSSIRLHEEEILNLLYEQASELMDTNYMHVAFYNESLDTVEFPLAFSEGKRVEMPARKAGGGLTENVMNNIQPILIETRKEWEEWHNQPGRQNCMGRSLSSWIGVPMKVGEKVLGVIATYHPTTDNLYNTDDLETLQSMADLVAIALENSRLYLQQEQQTRALEEANRRIAEKQDVLTRSMIASDFVHRMNNLAGTIPSWAGMIREEFENQNPDKLEIFDCVEHIIKDANGLLRAAEQLKTSHQKTELDISFMLQSILRQVEIQFAREIQKNRQLTVKKDIQLQLPQLWGNRASLSHALFNVISNGIDAILAKGSGTLTVKAESFFDEHHNEWVKIEMKDTGVGISEKIRDKIFTPFFTTKPTGGGYGLWRSKIVIEEEFSGIITLSSPQGTDTTFTIMLPIRPLEG